MSATFSEVLMWLKRVDEVSLLELLEISSEDLVDRFGDKIEEKYDQLVIEVEDEETLDSEGTDQ